ncbi:MAG: glycoside hydrolase family 3 C-terminal domain-containing protein [Bacteroidales bacterium]|nr:glycoside hydrolase family 3 C-terminal domain-containing protein [Bacteroidales bacterium]
MKRLIYLITGTLILLSYSCQKKAIYQDPTRPVEERVADLLSRMTLEEKLLILSGDSSGFDTRPIPRLGIPAIHITDGPLGVRWEKSTSFPAGVAVAATWDTALIYQLAQAMALETKAHGRDYLLGPCVGIHRMPLGGRNFESYSEDPHLAARMAVNWVKGLQSEKVISSVKHFATNDQEWERHKYDVIIDERSLREVHLLPFEAAVKEADAWTVMAAYNIQNGQHCTENYHLIRDILKGDWGFQGFLISDWVSVYSTVHAANAGLDLEMPVGVYFHPDSLKKYLSNGQIKQEVIDDKVRRILRVAFLAGLFDNPKRPDSTVFEKHKPLALKAALEAITLLKNENNILPIDKNKVKTIAVIGPNAAEAVTGGGGSSFVTPFYAVSPLEGLKKRFGDTIKFLYAQGDSTPRPRVTPAESTALWTPDKKQNGLQGEYFNNKNLEGKPTLTRVDAQVNTDYGTGSPDPSIKPNFFSVRWTGWLKVPESGDYVLSTLSDDGVRLYLDDKLVIDNWTNHGPLIDQFFCKLTAGKFYKIRLEFYEDGGGAVLKLGLKRMTNPNFDAVAEAAKIAAQADMAIVFAGANEMLESEGRDRDGLELPGKQEQLVLAVAKANPNTVVVLNGGTPTKTKNWLSKVRALVHMYYLGQETGNAIAQVLSGDFNPSGKLPFSFIADYNQSPAFKDYKKSLKVPYSEGVFVGYRYLDKNKMEPTFPFGFGLSYTTFEYKNLRITAQGSRRYTATVEISNTGTRAGDEVVQLYIAPPQSTIERPLKELKAFARVSLNPGETKTVTLYLKERDFAYWDINANGWKVEPGKYQILLGSSSKDIRLSDTIDVK